MARTCAGQILALGMTGDKSAVPARVPTVRRGTSSGSVVPGRECLAEMTVFVRETGSLSHVVNSLSRPFQVLTGERKIIKSSKPSDLWVTCYSTTTGTK
jgi:hypothetical protein